MILYICLVKSNYAVAIYTGKDFILNCDNQKYSNNVDICNTAITQAFSAYMVSLELIGGEKIAKCYRSYYPFLENKSILEGIHLLINQYKENPDLKKQLVGFGFSVAMFTSYPMPNTCKN